MRLRLAFLLTVVLTFAACGGGGATPIPSPSASPKPSPSDIFAPSAAPSEAASPEPPASPEPSTPPGAAGTYTVKKGDTMIKIAAKFGISVAALKAANPTVVPTLMKIGAVLTIPPK